MHRSHDVAHRLLAQPPSESRIGAAEALRDGAADAATSGLIDALMTCWAAHAREEHDRHYLRNPSRKPEWDGIGWGGRQEGPEERARLERAIGAVGTYIGQLAVLCRELEQAPIRVPTGQEKPRVRVRYVTHPQRSYQDVQNELAVQLANLPRFTVYASIQGEQRQIQLNPPAEGEIDEARIERIRQVGKARFGRPVGAPTRPEPGGMPERAAEPPAGPRIGREHPDEE